MREQELALIREARRWGIGREIGGVVSDLHVLALLQHYGVPTRLLDVTSNPMTAIWFACQRPMAAAKDASGAVMAFEVTGLPALQTATGESRSTWGFIGDLPGWHLSRALQESADAARPFLVEPSHRELRMQAQEGLFITGAVPTVPEAVGVDGLPLVGQTPLRVDALATLFAPQERKAGRPRSLPFVVLVIPTTLKQKMRSHLETTYNRSYRTLFPGVAGFADAVRRDEVPLPQLPV